MSGITERAFLPLTGVQVSCCEATSTVKLDTLGGGLFQNSNPPGGTGLSLVTFPKMVWVAEQAFEVTKPSK